LIYLCALLYGVLGPILFFLPEQMAPVFAWKVTPFMTMTIGGWCLGNAWLAYITARRWKWSLVYTLLIYLWLFGIGGAIVLFFFGKAYAPAPSRLAISCHPGSEPDRCAGRVVDWLRLAPANRAEGPAMLKIHRYFAVGL
jgi:hypothetical protein